MGFFFFLGQPTNMIGAAMQSPAGCATGLMETSDFLRFNHTEAATGKIPTSFHLQETVLIGAGLMA